MLVIKSLIIKLCLCNYTEVCYEIKTLIINLFEISCVIVTARN